MRRLGSVTLVFALSATACGDKQDSGPPIPPHGQYTGSGGGGSGGSAGAAGAGATCELTAGQKKLFDQMPSTTKLIATELESALWTAGELYDVEISRGVVTLQHDSGAVQCDWDCTDDAISKSTTDGTISLQVIGSESCAVRFNVAANKLEFALYVGPGETTGNSFAGF